MTLALVGSLPNYEIVEIVGKGMTRGTDGERFVMVDGSEVAQPPTVLVQNWAEELKRLVPTDK